MIMNEKKWWYIQWYYIRAKVHCRQNPQWHSGPDHFCIVFLKDDCPFDIFKLLDRLFHIWLPWYLIVLWPYVIVLNVGCMRGIKSLNSYAIHFLINKFFLINNFLYRAIWLVLRTRQISLHKNYLICVTPRLIKHSLVLVIILYLYDM